MTCDDKDGFSLISVQACVWLEKENDMTLITSIILIILMMILTALLSHRAYAKKLAAAHQHNLQWYRQVHPDAIKSTCVFCYHCHHSEVLARRTVIQQEAVKEHFCSHCGEVLFYSSIEE